MRRVFAGLSAALMAALVMVGCRSDNAPTASVAGPAPAAAPSPPVTLTVAQAREALTTAVKALPQDPYTSLELAIFDLKTNSVDAAQSELADCVKRFPRFARAPYQLGMYYSSVGNRQGALRYLQTAAAVAPADAEIQRDAGAVWFQWGDRKRAVGYLEKAIALDPQSPEPYLILARWYDHPGTASQAIADVNKYLERGGSPGQGYFLMGRLYSHRGDRANAVQWLQRAVQTDPNVPDYWVLLGRVYYDLFNSTQASAGIACFQKALAIDPNNSEAHRYYGHALLGQRQYEPAITQLRAAMQTSPDRGPLYYDLSQALIKAGHVEDGRNTLAMYEAYQGFQRGVDGLNRAITASPNDVSRRYALVRFCLDHHQPTAAQSVLDEIVTRFGNSAAVDRLQEEAASMRGAAPSSTPPPGAGPGGPGGAAPVPGIGDFGEGRDSNPGSLLEQGSQSGR